MHLTNTEYSVIGKKVPDVKGRDRVTGKMQFAVDLAVPGMLIARVMRSPHAHAKILNIDTSQAEKYPGVRAVVTYKDVSPIPFPGYNQRILDETVRFVGEEVAAVAADNEEIADAALSHIKVDYELLPNVLTVEEALAPGAPLIHPQGNIQVDFRQSRGDVASGFAEADFIFEDQYEVPVQVIASLRQFACLAEWDGKNLTVWDSSQAIFVRRAELADLLKIPLENVRVVSTYEGGGFGEDNKFRYLPLAALLSIKSRKPVKILMPHDYTFEAVPKKRHPASFEVKIGLKNDGTMTALQVKSIFNKGAYLAGGGAVPFVAAQALFNGYRVPNMSFEAKTVYTNTPPNGAYRGYGGSQTNFAVQSAIDDLSERMGLDPTEVHLKNVIRSNDKLQFGIRPDYNAPGSVLEVDFSKVGGSCLTEAIEIGREKIGWSRKRVSGKNAPDDMEEIHKGVGCALLTYGFGAIPETSSSLVKIRADGKIELYTGIADLGGGQRTVLAMIAAEEMGLLLDDVIVFVGDTNLPKAPHSIGSRTTIMAGNSTRLAIADAKKNLLNLAIQDLGLDSIADVEVRNSALVVKKTGIKIPLHEIMEKAGGAIEGRGVYDHTFMNSETGFQLGSCFAEVSVDTWTGKVTVDKLVMVQDYGQVLNPLGAQGQMIGGAIQALGYGLLEEYVTEPLTHQIVSRSWLDYRVPTCLDVPEMEMVFLEHPDPRYPFGAKGGGESMIVCAHSAIRNAIANAIGIRFHRIPITPNMIVESLTEKKRKANEKTEVAGS